MANLSKIYKTDKSTANTDKKSMYFGGGEYMMENSYFMSFVMDNHVSCFSGKTNDLKNSIFEIISENVAKEKFYVTAIKNLLKQKRYQSLVFELTNEMISEEEFDNEIEQNTSSYIIDVQDRIDSLRKFDSLLNVLSHIDEDFDEGDIIEIFSIQESIGIRNVCSHIGPRYPKYNIK